MNLSDSVIEEIRRQVYLIGDDYDPEGMRDSVRQMLTATAEQRAAGRSESELRAACHESMWHNVRKLGSDPGALLTAETILAVGSRMVEACIAATRTFAVSA